MVHLNGADRVREAIARDRGEYAPSGPVTLCGVPDGTELRADAPRWRWRLRRLRSGALALVRLRRAPSNAYGSNRLDWAGLSWRTLRGWFRGSQCLANCGSGHTYGRWCLLGPKR